MNVKLSALDILNAAERLRTTSICALDLQPITENSLRKNGIFTLEHLARADVSRILGVGMYGEVAIRRAMDKLGFSLEFSDLGLTEAQKEKVAA